MAMHRRSPRVSQPQTPGKLNSADSLGAILKYVWLPAAHKAIDINKGIVGLPPSTSYIKAGPEGLLLQNDAGTASTNVTINETGNWPCTLVMQARIQVPTPGNQFVTLDNLTNGASFTGIQCGSSTQMAASLRNNFGTTRTPVVTLAATTNVTLTAMLVIYSNTDYRLFCNGLQTNDTLDFSGVSSPWNRIRFGGAMNGGISIVGYAPGRTISDSEALRITRNPSAIWDAFVPLPRRVWVGTAAGGATFNPYFSNQSGQVIGAGVI